MFDNHDFVIARIKRFIKDQLTPHVYIRHHHLDVTQAMVDGEPIPFAKAMELDFHNVSLPLAWGKAWTTNWYHIQGTVPNDWAHDPDVISGRLAVEALFDLGFDTGRSGFHVEGLVFRPDGSTVKALSPLNFGVPIDSKTTSLDFFVEAAANPDVTVNWEFRPHSLAEFQGYGTENLYSFNQASVALRDVALWILLQDLSVLMALLAELSLQSTRYHEILRGLEEAIDLINPDDVYGTVCLASERLHPIMSAPAHASAHQVFATGHAHIDSAWLWPLRETVRKCARTYSNALALMEIYPDYVFSCSAAQHFEWIKQFYPELFSRISQRVAEGRFVPVGGMWVESDTNMPGSEAMARQFLMGKNFFLENFGIDTQEVWLPDSFGYSGGLPQIVKASGARWFLTQKISWNQFNRMPHHTFLWEGIDGSRVFTHFPPSDTYNSDLLAADLLRSERQFAEKGKSRSALIPFGWGDGGGGPTREMIEAGMRSASLEGLPKVKIGRADTFFATAEAEYPNPPVWSGEMYLELHRGVFTSQLRTKQGNRRNENLLREAEIWLTHAHLQAGMEYPLAKMKILWQKVLLNQFHDILPGSSVAWVHREVEMIHAAVTDELHELITSAIQALVGEGTLQLAANASIGERQGVSALSIAPLEVRNSSVRSVQNQDHLELRNDFISVSIMSNGEISSLRDNQTGREAIAPGVSAGQLRLHHDLPNLWDAWDIDEHYRRTVTELTEADSQEVQSLPDGSCVVTTMRTFGRSILETRMILRPDSKALEIEIEVDWHESRKLLKYAFPLDIHAERVAVETQFGYIYRPTHVNTSWEFARFETCQHKWMHVAEPGYGVSLSNDSTYGYDTDRRTRPDGGTTTTVRFSLIRAPKYPDQNADQGKHTMRFRIAPHSSFTEAVALGFDTNIPLRMVCGERAVKPVVSSSNCQIPISALKLADDGSGDVILRVYEATGARASTRLQMEFDFFDVWRTDLIERRIDGEVKREGKRIDVELRPFELRTFRFRCK